MIDSDPDTTESGAERQSSADAGLESECSPRGEQGSSPHCDLTEAARPERRRQHRPRSQLGTEEQEAFLDGP